MTTDCHDIDRLFVPLKTEFWRAFERGDKRWEVRTLGGQFTRETVYEGRPAELRRGYSTDDSLWGTIAAVRVFDRPRAIVASIPPSAINPMAPDRQAIIESIRDVLEPEDEDRFIAFKIPDTVNGLKEYLAE